MAGDVEPLLKEVRDGGILKDFEKLTRIAAEAGSDFRWVYLRLLFASGLFTFFLLQHWWDSHQRLFVQHNVKISRDYSVYEAIEHCSSGLLVTWEARLSLGSTCNLYSLAHRF